MRREKVSQNGTGAQLWRYAGRRPKTLHIGGHHSQGVARCNCTAHNAHTRWPATFQARNNEAVTENLGPAIGRMKRGKKRGKCIEPSPAVPRARPVHCPMSSLSQSEMRSDDRPGSRCRYPADARRSES